MNTLKFGNGEWYGKEGTILAYNDENYNYKPLPFNFERDSSATVVNKDGLIETVGIGQPRIDYKDDSKGALLLEPSRSNLFQRSEDFTQGWTEARIETPYIADVVSPNGTLNAYTLEMSSGETSGGGIYNVGTSISGDNSFSVFAKKGNADYLVLGDTGLDSSRNAVYFNLSNGTIGTEYQNAVGEMKYFGNGWYRCTMKYSLTSNANKFIYLTNKNGETTNSVVGGDFIYIYGAQLEQGSYPTSYIPTQGSAVTRLAESSTNCGAGTNIFSNTSAVWFIDFSRFVYDSSINTKSAALENSSGSEQIRFHFDYPSKTVRFRDAKNGLANIGGNIVTETNIRKKVALKIDGTTLRVFADGVKIGSDYTRPTGFDIDKMSLYSSGTNVFDIKFYNTSLTDQELIELTS